MTLTLFAILAAVAVAIVVGLVKFQSYITKPRDRNDPPISKHLL
jgi:hypothetical protein